MKTLKLIIILCAVLFIAWSCVQKPPSAIPAEWVKQYHVIPCGRGVSDIVWFDDHVVAHTGDHSFIVLESTGFRRDSAYEALLGKHSGQLATSFSGDSLFALERDRKYWWNKNTLKWTPAGHHEEPACSPLFEDADYLVTRICHGEFGGGIAFLNKKTGKTHGAPMTCPVQVEKSGGKYYILSYLGHLGDYSSITVVPDPEEMPEYPDCESVYSTSAGIERRIGNYFIQGRKLSLEDSLEYAGVHRGATTWMTNWWVSNALLFKKDQPYLLFTDTSNLIGKLEKDTLIAIDRIAGSNIRLEGTVTHRDGAHFFSFADWDTRGFVFVKNDTIHIVVFKPG